MPTSIPLPMPYMPAERARARHPLILQTLLMLILSGALVAISISAPGDSAGSSRGEIAGP